MMSTRWTSPTMTSSPGDSPASPSPTPAGEPPRTTSDGSGPSSSESFAWYDPHTSSWKTSQGSLLSMMEQQWERYSAPWPRSGMTRSGKAFPRPQLELRISDGASSSSPIHKSEFPTPRYGTGGNGSGNNTLSRGRPSLESMARSNLWPTPTASRTGDYTVDGKTKQPRLSLQGEAKLRYWPTPQARDGDPQRGAPSPEVAQKRWSQGKRGLDDAVAMWPTPTTGDHMMKALNVPPSGVRGRLGHAVADSDPTLIGGKLNPTWVEWLMGFPAGWTDLEDSETR